MAHPKGRYQVQLRGLGGFKFKMVRLGESDELGEWLYEHVAVG